jgi:RHS repeat-associated protein
MNGVATVYLSNYLEMSGTSLTKDFYAGTQRIAMRTGTSNPQWILGDHLSSTTTIANATGGWVGTQLYRAWGEDRLSQGSIPTRYRYTGQYDYQSEIGLYYYGARWYDASLSRWAQPDSIIPEAQQGVQAWDRYGFVNNNPLRYIDPLGHSADCGIGDPNCVVGEYTPYGLISLYKGYYGYESIQYPRTDVTEKLSQEIDDYLVNHPNYDFKDDITTGGSSTVNRGHVHHLAINAFSARDRLPRCLSGSQPGRGTRYNNSSLTLQI